MSLTNFIEDNIDTIENENWVELYRELYNFLSDWNNTRILPEFFQLMDKCVTPEFKNYTKHARTVVIREAMSKIYSKYLTTMKGDPVFAEEHRGLIYFNDITAELNTSLGFTIEELREILSTMGPLGITVRLNNQYAFNVNQYL